MKNYIIFLKKELFESIKTYKLVIMLAVFLVFGMISPLTAKFTPEILKWAMESDPSTAGMDLSGLLTEPAAFDSWVQFFGSNTGQMGLIVLVIVFSGMISSELSRGTLTIMLSKGLSRAAVILSKLTSAVLIWTVSFILSFLTAWGYTAYMFEDSVPNLFAAVFCLWVFGVFLLALTALMATLTSKGYACMLSVGAVSVVLALLTLIPNTAKYNPSSLIGSPLQFLSGEAAPRRAYPALVVAAIGIAAFTTLAVIIFSKNKKKARKKTALLAGAVVVCMALTVFIGEGAPGKINLARHVVSEKIIIGAGTDWALNGVLTVPKNASGKVPAVVLVHGSGANDMDGTIFDNKPFRDIAEYLASNGVAVLRYNMRSLTYWNKFPESFTVWEEKIEDALLATEMLKSDPRIDETRVYILGHSFGGMLAPRINFMGGDYAGLIIFASSPRFLLDISKTQNIAYAESMADGAEKDAALESIAQWDEYYGAFLALPDEDAKNTPVPGWGGITAYYLKDLYENPVSDYLEKLEKTGTPLLIMQAGADVQVSADVDFAMYQELLADNPNAAFKLYPGLNHLFMRSTGRGISEIMDEYKIKSSVDKQVLRDIADWIKSVK